MFRLNDFSRIRAFYMNKISRSIIMVLFISFLFLTIGHAKESDISKCKSGIVIKESSSSAFDVLINKSYSLNESYKPTDLSTTKVPFPKNQTASRKWLRGDAARQLEYMYAAMKKEKLKLIAVSGYRSYESQKSILLAQLQKKSFAQANATVACPGQSEHQSGLAIDVSSESYGGQIGRKFDKTKEYKWISKYAHKYGFVIRYPKHKTKITHYNYEPWHLRYVGPKLASEMKKNDWVLEEYVYVQAKSKKSSKSKPSTPIRATSKPKPTATQKPLPLKTATKSPMKLTKTSSLKVTTTSSLKPSAQMLE